MKSHLKGCPDFVRIDDESLAEYRKLAQQMIFSYKGVSKEIEEALTTVWNDLKNEECRRMEESLKEQKFFDDVVPKPSIHSIKRVTKKIII